MIRLIVALVLLPVVAFAAKAPDTPLVTGPNNAQVPSGNILITPNGGTQTTLGAALSGSGSSGYVATGAITAITAPNRAALQLNLKDFGAVFDGTSHPLSATYATLAAAQAVYPFVTSLTEEIDGVSVQAAINYCGTSPQGATIHTPTGSGNFSRPIINTFPMCNLIAPINSDELIYSVGNITTVYSTRFRAAANFSGGALLRISPIESLVFPNSNINGSGIQGIVLDCNKLPGCTGLIDKSTVNSQLNFGVVEPKEYAATTSASSAAGSSTLTFASTASIVGLEVGAAISAHPYIARGTSVYAFDGTTITLSQPLPVAASFTASISGTTMTVTAPGTGLIATGQVIVSGAAAGTTIIQPQHGTYNGEGTYTVSISQTVASTTMTTGSGVANGDTVGIAGEGARFDTGTTWGSNTISWDDVNYAGLNSTGYAPLIAVIGSGPALGSSGSCCGNAALNVFHRVICFSLLNDCLVLGNSDHNYFAWFQNYPLNPNTIIGSCIISLASNFLAGSVPGGQSYANHFGYTSCQQPIVVQGTESGTYPSVNQWFDWLDYNNGTQLPFMGTGAISYAASDQGRPLSIDGSLLGVQAQLADGTALRGIARGQKSVDLQTTRDNSGQVAFGTYSTLSGGYGNQAYAFGSAVTGGLYNISGAIYSTVGGRNAYAYGYGWDCHASNNSGANQVSEACTANLNIVSNSATAFRLTGDGLTPTTGVNSTNNCLNIIDNSQATMDIELTAVDRSNTNLWYSWHEPHSVLKRKSGVASTTYTASGTAAAIVGGGMSASVSATADTTNGCLNLSFTPPAANADFIGVTATVRFTWGQ